MTLGWIIRRSASREERKARLEMDDRVKDRESDRACYQAALMLLSVAFTDKQ